MLLQLRSGQVMKPTANPVSSKEEFASGWREKKFSEMSESEIDRFFDEVGLLAALEGTEH